MGKDMDMDKAKVEDMVAVVVDTILIIAVVLRINKKNNSNHHKWNNSEAQPEKWIEPQSKHAHENECYKYRMKGH